MMMPKTKMMMVALLFGLTAFAAPALACMEHESDWYVDEPQDVEPEPVSMAPAPSIGCESDMGCPSGMLCEPVACCMAEGCVCPTGLCELPPTGAQGRDCEADVDCGEGFFCVMDTPLPCGDDLGVADASCLESPLGWCEAEASPPEMPRDEVGPESQRSADGCQGGQDHGLPLSAALCLLALVWMRRRQEA